MRPLADMSTKPESVDTFRGCVDGVDVTSYRREGQV